MSCRVAVLAVAAALLAVPESAGAQSLSYEFFKGKVEPIFLKKRPGHTRCIVCHAGANNAMRLTPLTAGAANFSEEQSKTNFETVSRIVMPGKPMESHFLIHPLDPHFGGGMYHSGGRQFETTDDPDWKNMAAWVNGAK
ncbi:MAG: hypothetical protein QOI12_2291 [Alphaproteobacteria bacterium]|jgi:hypothetical protein|nr:hypothetical protein [Alphaproteobacteria bacterium]